MPEITLLLFVADIRLRFNTLSVLHCISFDSLLSYDHVFPGCKFELH